MLKGNTRKRAGNRKSSGKEVRDEKIKKKEKFSYKSIKKVRDKKNKR